MIAWLHPAALATLALLAAPVLVHLLLRRRARRVSVPTVRFVPARSDSSVRLHEPSEAWLLLLRTLTVACAALAAAQPLILTEMRRGAWEQRRAIAVVVDEAASLERHELIRSQRAGAHVSTVISAADPAHALDRAAGWLLGSSSAVREIVLISPFVHDTLSAADLARVPPGIGIRFHRVERSSRPSEAHVDRLLTSDGSLARLTTVDGERTHVRLSPSSESLPDGVRLLTAPADAPAAAALLRVVARAGTVAPSADRPLVIRFRGADPLPSWSGAAAPWTFAAAARLLEWSRESGIELSVAPGGRELRVQADVAPASVEAAEILDAALAATQDTSALRRLERQTIEERTLQAWARHPAPPEADAWRRAGDSDGRWLWLAALVLLAAEARVRRRRHATGIVEAARAA